MNKQQKEIMSAFSEAQVREFHRLVRKCHAWNNAGQFNVAVQDAVWNFEGGFHVSGNSNQFQALVRKGVVEVVEARAEGRIVKFGFEWQAVAVWSACFQHAFHGEKWALKGGR